MEIKIKIGENGKVPAYAHETDAGADLFASEDYIISPATIEMIETDLYVEIPAGYFGGIYSKSGLASKGVSVANSPGILDSDYRGMCKVLLHNFNKVPYKIQKGDKIAQLILHKFEHADFIETKELSDTKRGAGGFGSTGKK